MTQEEYIQCLPPYYRMKLIENGTLEYEDLRNLVRSGHGWLAVNFVYTMKKDKLLPIRNVQRHTLV